MPRVRVSRPRVDGVATSEAADDSKRVHAATEAVELSWGWGPDHGLAKGLAHARPEVIVKYKASAVKKIARFEPRVIYGAMGTWFKWIAYCS